MSIGIHIYIYIGYAEPYVEVQPVLLLAGDYSLFEVRPLGVTEGLNVYAHTYVTYILIYYFIYMNMYTL